MAGGTPAGGAVEVELVEGAGPDDARDVARRRRPRWPVWAGVVVLVAVGATSVAHTAADERRERDRREALADVPGLLPHLDGPLEEAWRAPDGVLWAVGSDVVVLAALRGEQGLTGVDLRTGARMWTRPGEDETCRPLGERSGPARLAEPGPVEHLACYPFVTTADGDRAVLGEPADVVVLDVATGTQVATVPTPGDVLGVELAGHDVLVASLDREGAVVVARWDLPPAGLGGTADEVWARRLDEPLERIDELGWVFHVETDVVRVGTVDSAPLDLATGEPRPDAARDGVLYTMDAVLPGGARVEWDFDAAGMGTGTSRVVPAGGGDVVELDGVPWLPDVTDGSAPGVLLLRRPGSVYDAASGNGDVVAVDPASGADLWSGGRMAGVEPLVQIEGILVTAGAGKVVALDVRSGDVVWQDRVDGVGFSPSGLTDGDVVVLTERAGRDLALVARDLGTGVARWRASLGPPGLGGPSLTGSGAGVLVSYADRTDLFAP